MARQLLRIQKALILTHENTRRSRDIQAAPSTAAPVKQQGSTAVKSIIALVSAVILLVTGVGYFAVGRLGGDLTSASNLRLGGGEGFQADTADGAVDILLVGSDSRTDAQGNMLSDEELDALHAGVSDGEENTDTMMLVRVPEDGSRATAVSIPRDTYVDQGEFGNMKINGVYSAHKQDTIDKLKAEDPDMDEKELEQKGVEAGRSALLEQVKDLTGVEIDHYAEIGLLGFVLLTDAVGGVDVCLNNPVDDPMSGAKFDAGEQTISGADALAFVRQRYELPRGDLDRIVRQQAYMASLVSKMLDAGTLTNPNTLSKISNAVERSVVIDEGWDIMGFITQLAGLAGGNVTFTTIPVTSIDGQGDYGESIVTVDQNEVHTFIDDLAQSKEEAEAEESTEHQPAKARAKASRPTVTSPCRYSTPVAPRVWPLVWLAGPKVRATPSMPAPMHSRASTSNPRSLLQIQTTHAPRNSSEKLGGVPVTANASLNDSTIIIVAADDYAGPSDEAAEEASPDDAVGTPGGDFGNAEVAPEIDAGGDGPRCVN
ncbi:Transcriptional attenuator, LytR family [Corynebacterium camporealensis]|nr:Transcriptional attenuator, LytR family [Corynebacterium camporealensis]